MIGVGSVVTKDVPAGELWVGSPAKFVRKLYRGGMQKYSKKSIIPLLSK